MAAEQPFVAQAHAGGASSGKNFFGAGDLAVGEDQDIATFAVE